MKKTYNYLAFFGSLVMSFFVFSSVHAYVFSQEFQDSSQTVSLTGATVEYGQVFTSPATGKLWILKLPITQTTGLAYQCRASVCPKGSSSCVDAESVIVTNNADMSDQANWPSSSWTLTGGAGDFNLVAGNQYYIGYNCNTTPSYKFYGTANTSTYSGGDFGQSYNFGSSVTTTAVGDSLFKMTIYLSSGSAINFASTPTSTCDFSAWQIQSGYSAADRQAALTNNWAEAVRFGAYGAPLVYENIDTVPCVEDSCSDAAHGIPKGTLLPVGIAYQAQALIIDNPTRINANTIKYSSPIWTFITTENGCSSTLQQSSFQGFQLPFATSTNGGDNLTCSASSGFFTNGMCNLFQWLFTPDQRALDRFSKELYPAIQKKPPFGYLTVFSSQISSFSSSTSATSTLVSVTSTTGLAWSNISQISIFSTIRDVFSWFLWVVFVFYVFNRAKNFSLQG